MPLRMIEFIYRHPIVRFFWHALALLVFPLIVWLYSRIAEVPYDVIDTGMQQHKTIIVVTYLVFILVWRWLSLRVERRIRMR